MRQALSGHFAHYIIYIMRNAVAASFCVELCRNSLDLLALVGRRSIPDRRSSRWSDFLLFVIRQFCPVEVEILVREADIVGPP